MIFPDLILNMISWYRWKNEIKSVHHQLITKIAWQESWRMARLYLLCGLMPPVPPDDIGTWRRLRVVPFKSRFD